MSSANPVFGNNGFSKVENLAGQLSSLNASDGTVVNLTTSALDAGFVQTFGEGQLVTRYAYAPKTFSTLGVGSGLSLMKAPGLSAATATTDTNLFKLPDTATVVGAFLDNNGTTVTSGGAATVSVGTGTALNGAVVTALTAGTTVALLNSGASVGNGQSAVLAGANLLGGTGAAPGAGFDAVTAGAGETLLNVVGAVAALTAGDLRVAVTYFQPHA